MASKRERENPPRGTPANHGGCREAFQLRRHAALHHFCLTDSVALPAQSALLLDHCQVGFIMLELDLVLQSPGFDDAVFIDHPGFGWILCPRDLWSPHWFEDNWSLHQLWLLYGSAIKEARGY